MGSTLLVRGQRQKEKSDGIAKHFLHGEALDGWFQENICVCVCFKKLPNRTKG